MKVFVKSYSRVLSMLINLEAKKILFFVALFFLSTSINSQDVLEEYIKIAESKNPDINAFNISYEVSKEKENEVKSFADTQIGMGYFLSEPETHAGEQRMKVSARQMIPWFGTNAAKVKHSNSLSDIDYMGVVIAKRKLKLSVSTSYFKLVEMKKRDSVIDENIRLLGVYKKLALTFVKVGKATAVDILQLEIRRNELKELKEFVKQDFEAEREVFNGLLGRSTNSNVRLNNETIVLFSDTTASDKELSLHPELLRYDRLLTSIDQLELVNQKEKKPKIGVGLDYIVVSKRPRQTYKDNGKDVVLTTMSLSIPIFTKKYNSRTRQNNLRKQEIVFQKEEKIRALSATLSKAIVEKNKALIRYNTQISNIEQTKSAEQILMKNYETGIVDFNDILDIQELQLKFQIAQIESIKQYQTNQAIINYLTNKN